MRPIGKLPAMSCSKASSVAAIILERKGPQARVLTVMDGPTFAARCRESLTSATGWTPSTMPIFGSVDDAYWCKAALLAE